MANDTQLTSQLVRALAQGDKAAATGLLRDAGLPALRQAMGELRAMTPEDRQALKARVLQASGPVADAEVLHGVQGHAQAASQALRAHGRKPTVEMGDSPGGLRWVLALVLLALGAWAAFGWG